LGGSGSSDYFRGVRSLRGAIYAVAGVVTGLLAKHFGLEIWTDGRLWVGVGTAAEWAARNNDEDQFLHRDPIHDDGLSRDRDGTLAGATTPNEIDVLVGLRITLFRIFPWSTGFTRSDFYWGAVAPHGCSGGGITVVPKSNGQVLRVGPRASRVAMRAHNRKIRFSLWRYLNLLDLHSLETLAEWTGKAAVLVSLCGQVAHATPPLIRGFGCLRHRMWNTPS
jgi:hypothetical protein